VAELRRPLLVTGALTVLLVLLVLAAPEHRVVETDRRASAQRASPSGVRALYLTLERLGIPVAQRQAPLADAGPLPTALVLLEPSLPLTPREVANVRAMVEAGGTLIYAAGFEQGLLAEFGLGTTWLRREAGGYASLTAAPVPHRLTAGMDSVAGFHMILVASDDGPAPGTPLLTVEDTVPVALELTVGAGRVIVLADVEPLTNAEIGGSGAALLLARLGAELATPERPLVFGEFHHGLKRRGVLPALGRFLGGRPAGHALLQLGAVALLGLLAAGRRFGEPVRAPPPSRRSPLEHVDALARVYTEARASRVPRLLLVGGLARRLNRPRPHSLEEAQALVARLGAVVPAAESAARELEALLGREDAEIEAVAQAVDHLLEQLRR
jgi:hypothetical protein